MILLYDLVPFAVFAPAIAIMTQRPATFAGCEPEGNRSKATASTRNPFHRSTGNQGINFICKILQPSKQYVHFYKYMCHGCIVPRVLCHVSFFKVVEKKPWAMSTRCVNASASITFCAPCIVCGLFFAHAL